MSGMDNGDVHAFCVPNDYIEKLNYNYNENEKDRTF